MNVKRVALLVSLLCAGCPEVSCHESLPDWSQNTCIGGAKIHVIDGTPVCKCEEPKR